MSKHTLSCEDFDPNVVGCCSSCHYDADHGLSELQEAAPPGRTRHTSAWVCCAIRTTDIRVWAKALRVRRTRERMP